MNKHIVTHKFKDITKVRELNILIDQLIKQHGENSEIKIVNSLDELANERSDIIISEVSKNG
ncbi:hypothetical protein N9043_00235 [bacterium]|nr:hypothetical protein [bacterium]